MVYYYTTVYIFIEVEYVLHLYLITLIHMLVYIDVIVVYYIYVDLYLSLHRYDE